MPPSSEPTQARSTMTLEELHALVRDVWLTRFDDELEAERASRRSGRPKSVKEVKLETLLEREREEYRTGFGLCPFFRYIFYY